MVWGSSPSGERHAKVVPTGCLAALRWGGKRTAHPFRQWFSEKRLREKERNPLSWGYRAQVQVGSASEPGQDTQSSGNRSLHLHPSTPSRTPLIITHLGLSLPMTLTGENRFFSASTVLSLRNDYLILPTHYLSSHYSQQVQHQNLAASLRGTHSFPEERGFTCTVLLHQALGHISCWKSQP